MFMARRLLIMLTILTLVYSCKRGGGDHKGELVGVKGKSWKQPRPYGMTLVPSGSFIMGSSDDDKTGSLNAPVKTVSVGSFYMDETEITNSEYRQFVNWVRDSIIRTNLAELADQVGQTQGNGGVGEYAYLNTNTENMNAYQQYMYNTYGDQQTKKLNRKVQLIWDTNKFPDEYYSEVMDKMYLPIEESYNGKRIMDVEKFVFKYQWLDMEKSARAKGNRKDFVKEELVKVYPDTTVWIRDFAYSYNEPMHNQYFWHEAYGEYPVVGVTWMQAKAFCEWRTLNKNSYLKAKGDDEINSFRLPIESEWEYAARGGLEGATYPWGGPYTTDDRACFLANFKPLRGDYASDNALYTVEARSYEPNGYNLYNMAGNVSEWTNTTYDPNSYEYMSTMNPNVIDEKNRRKVIRGGSWKDTAYMLQVNTRDFEYQDSARSYIGFRTVQDFMGVSEGQQAKTARGFR
ncbi:MULTISPECIES: gliding motility lipoprotein GldK [Capnocytophaga]|uniref:Gliding motility lipoprotein GldK n=5 Tax=Capnocytophaga canis TaxID=1848903 RepID=A0A3A1YB29_9FLAO|nr:MULTISPECIES: gliding motility lipoprotein GldK [Capnocytophaga]ATA72851.1 gliding motility lipoprotein GldK [Capnocytophaga sp. H4358]ATA74945.1 gliding motility lipoprotein GldK [Capnocytophaga sp. H2931]RIY35513.1 gliding motility lipoprotein GldK [Capnocytophaga canis]